MYKRMHTHTHTYTHTHTHAHERVLVDLKWSLHGGDGGGGGVWATYGEAVFAFVRVI